MHEKPVKDVKVKLTTKISWRIERINVLKYMLQKKKVKWSSSIPMEVDKTLMWMICSDKIF